MSRTIKDHDTRQNEILDATQRLIYTKGYEQMTIQDILDILQISKGAFYHYFDSKQALLEALVERTLDDALEMIIPVMQDPNLKSLEKLERYFSLIARWKVEQKDYMLALMSVWYSDDNAIVRQKLDTSSTVKVIPLLTSLIHQGIEEGILKPTFPDQAAAIMMSILEGFANAIAILILSQDRTNASLNQLENLVGAYTDAVERVLGAPQGSIHLIDLKTLREWFI